MEWILEHQNFSNQKVIVLILEEIPGWHQFSFQMAVDQIAEQSLNWNCQLSDRPIQAIDLSFLLCRMGNIRLSTRPLRHASWLSIHMGDVLGKSRVGFSITPFPLAWVRVLECQWSSLGQILGYLCNIYFLFLLVLTGNLPPSEHGREPLAGFGDGGPNLLHAHFVLNS